jgi:outer membrane protein assembly factor BamA
VTLLLALALAVAAPFQFPPPAREVIAEIQIHGNNATGEDEILALAGVKRGDPFEEALLSTVRDRLKQSGRFEGVEVRKRFASISDLSQIALVIVIDEHPVSIIEVPNALPGAGARIARRSALGWAMVLPILDGEDGYGLTYGALLAYPDVAGKRSRLVFPLSWGGRKQAGARFELTPAQGLVNRVEVGATITRRTNPAFEKDDDRARVWGRAERLFGELRVGVTSAFERVRFAGDIERWKSVGGDVTLDTRLNPVFPRNAVYAKAEWTHLVGERFGGVNRTSLDARGYVGLVGQAVLVARAERLSADRSLPDYFKPLLGGWSSLRGFQAGAFVGDTRVNGSLEIRVPFTSPLAVGKTGVSVFTDVGKSYDRPTRFADAPLHRGVGSGVWWSATVVQFGVSVARGEGRTRVNVGLGVAF